MKKTKRIALASIAAALGTSAVGAGLIFSIAPSFVQGPKFLGVDSNGIAQYEFTNKKIWYKNREYANSHEAVVENIIQAELAGKNDEKIIMGKEKYLGDAESSDFNGGSFATLKLEEAIKSHKMFKFENENEDKDKEVKLSDRVVELYENPRNNSSSVNPYDRFLTSLDDAKKAVIANFDNPQRYTDGFGGLFFTQEEAARSNSANLKNTTAVGQGYYLVNDRSVTDASGAYKSYRINPLNPYDKKLLKQIAINNLGLLGSDFSIEVFNKNLETPPNSDTGDGNTERPDQKPEGGEGEKPAAKESRFLESSVLNTYGSKEITKGIVGLFSQYMYSKLLETMRFDVNINPTWMQQFTLKIDFWDTIVRNPLKPGTIRKKYNHKMIPDTENNENSWADKDIGPASHWGWTLPRNANENAFFSLTINDKSDLTLKDVSYNDMLDIKNTLSDRGKFVQKFNITTDKHDLYTSSSHSAKDPFAERATAKNLWGQQQIEIGIDTDWNSLGWALDRHYTPQTPPPKPSKPSWGSAVEQGKYDPFWGSQGSAIVNPKERFVRPNHQVYTKNGQPEFKFLDKNTDPSTNIGNKTASGIGFDIRITPIIKTDANTIMSWKKDFIHLLESDSQFINHAFDKDKTLINREVDNLFKNFASWIINDFSKSKTYVPYGDLSKFAKFLPLGGLDNDFNFENSSSLFNQFMLDRNILDDFNKKYVTQTSHNFARNIENKDAALILKYKKAPLYFIEPKFLKDEGILDMITQSDSRGTYVDLVKAHQLLKNCLIDNTRANSLYNALINISNKVELKSDDKNNDVKRQKYRIPENNIDENPENDTYFVNFKEDDTNNFKKLNVPKSYIDLIGTDNNAVDNIGLNISNNDSVDFLKRNSGIFLIAQQYNKQLDRLYHEATKPGGPDINNYESPEFNNLVKSLDDVVILFEAEAKDDKLNGKINDYMQPAYYTEVFNRLGTYNETLNNPYVAKKWFDSVPARDEFYGSLAKNVVDTVYVYTDLNNNILNQNKFNSKEGALSEAYKNISLTPSMDSVLVVDESKYVENKPGKEYKLTDGYIVKKEIQNIFWINAGRLRNPSENNWQDTRIYFSNHQNAFNYCRYLFELSYSKKD